MIKNYFYFLILLVFTLAACGGNGGSDSSNGGGNSAPAPVGNAANGEKLYLEPVIGAASAPGCATCHSLEPDKTIVGPSHAAIGADANARVPGKSAEEYLRDSIENPDADVTEGFPAGIMYQDYATALSQQEIDDLVAFLLTRK